MAAIVPQEDLFTEDTTRQYMPDPSIGSLLALVKPFLDLIKTTSDRHDAEVYTTEAMRSLDSGKFDQALSFINAAISKSESDTESLPTLNILKAMECCKDILKIDPMNRIALDLISLLSLAGTVGGK